MKLRRTITYIAIYIFLLVTLVALIRYFSPWRQTVPEADIIYVPRSEASQLGFVNADGSNSSLITLSNCTFGRFVFTLGGCRYESLSQPVWSADGRYVYGLTGPLSYYIASPAYWDTWKGRMKYCSRRDLPYFLQVEGAGNPENPAEVLIGNVGSILRMDLDTCAYQTIFDYPPGEHPTEGFSYNPTIQVFLYGLTSATNDPNQKPDFHVIKYDPKIGEAVVLAEGIKPSWSPDGTHIAYLGVEGIYIMGANGENQTLVQRESFYDAYYHSFSFTAPTPRWSPDGVWLLYTGCGQAKCEVDSLYKVPAQGGPAVLLATDVFSGSGSWRP